MKNEVANNNNKIKTISIMSLILSAKICFVLWQFCYCGGFVSGHNNVNIIANAVKSCSHDGVSCVIVLLFCLLPHCFLLPFTFLHTPRPLLSNRMTTIAFYRVMEAATFLSAIKSLQIFWACAINVFKVRV